MTPQNATLVSLRTGCTFLIRIPIDVSHQSFSFLYLLFVTLGIYVSGPKSRG
jgi:hypothetical protein